MILDRRLNQNIYQKGIIKKYLYIMYFDIFTGGLATVIYLDTLMAFVMVGGAAIMTFIGKKSNLIYKRDFLRLKGLLR